MADTLANRENNRLQQGAGSKIYRVQFQFDCMETKGRLQRTIINVLSRWDDNTGKFKSNTVCTTGEPLTAVQRLGTDSNNEYVKTSLSRSFRSLEEKGLVRRTEPPDEDNHGNQVWWELTEKGLEEAKQLANSYANEFDELRRKYGGTWPKVA